MCIENVKTVLIIDDDIDVAHSTRDILEDKGFNVIICHDLKGFRMNVGRADVVISDVWMYGNKEDFSAIRSHCVANQIPLVASSGDLELVHRFQVTKPFKPNHIVMEIKKSADYQQRKRAA